MTKKKKENIKCITIILPNRLVVNAIGSKLPPVESTVTLYTRSKPSFNIFGIELTHHITRLEV